MHSPDAGLSLAWNSLDLEGSFSGHPLGGSLRVRRGRIRAVNKPYPPLDTTTQGEASLSGGRIRVAQFRMTLQDAAVSLHGEVALAEQRSRFDAELSEVPLDRLLELIGAGRIGVDRVSGGLTVETEGDNTALFKADLSGPIHGRQTRARIEAGLQDGIVTYEIDALPSLRITGRLRLDDLNTEAFVQANEFDLSFLAKQWTRSVSRLSVTGKADFAGNLDKKATWKGEVKIGEFVCSFPDLLIVSTRPIALRIDKGLLAGNASLEANGRPLSLQGSYSFMHQGNVRLKGNTSLALENFLEPTRSFLPSLQSWKGDLRVQGTLEGPARAPRLHAVADLSNGSFRLASPEEPTPGRPPAISSHFS